MVACTSVPATAGVVCAKVITTGERTATTGMNCGFDGSHVSITFEPVARKSMWLRFVPVGK